MLNKRLEKAGSLETVHTHTHHILTKELLDSLERERERVTFRVKASFIFDANKSEENREKNRIDNSKKLIKEWINKKDGLLYGKLESTKFSSYKSYDSLSFL